MCPQWLILSVNFYSIDVNEIFAFSWRSWCFCMFKLHTSAEHSPKYIPPRQWLVFTDVQCSTFCHFWVANMKCFKNASWHQSLSGRFCKKTPTFLCGKVCQFIWHSWVKLMQCNKTIVQTHEGFNVQFLLKLVRLAWNYIKIVKSICTEFHHVMPCIAKCTNAKNIQMLNLLSLWNTIRC